MWKLFDLKTGLENLKRYIKVAPEDAGVYRMISINDEVLYVGKAKNIKKRIVSYSHIEKLSKQAKVYKKPKSEILKSLKK